MCIHATATSLRLSHSAVRWMPSSLGGTGKESGDRHPKVRHGVLLGANASIIGNIEVGEGAKVGAGSVVMKDVPAHVTVAGVPAEIVGKPKGDSPALDVDQSF